MASRGRPRKPIQAKIILGTFRADRDGDPSQAVPTSGVPAMPDFVWGRAKEFWEAVVPDLVARRIAGESDAAALGLLCYLYGELRDIIDLIKVERKPGHMVSFGICFDKFDRLASKFGYTPSDRAKLKADPAPAQRGVGSRKRG